MPQSSDPAHATLHLGHPILFKQPVGRVQLSPRRSLHRAVVVQEGPAVVGDGVPVVDGIEAHDLLQQQMEFELRHTWSLQ